MAKTSLLQKKAHPTTTSITITAIEGLISGAAKQMTLNELVHKKITYVLTRNGTD